MSAHREGDPSHDRSARFAVEAARPEDAEAVIDLFVEDLRDLRAPVTGEAVGVLVANELLSVKFAGRSLWIEELYVGKRWRRNGLGRLMVVDLLERARTSGVRGIDLEAYQGNAPAALLYRALGFRRLGRERFHYRFDWEDEG